MVERNCVQYPENRVMASSGDARTENSFIIQLEDGAQADAACEAAIVKGAEKAGCGGVEIRKLGSSFINIRCATTPTGLSEAQLKKCLIEEGVAVALLERDSVVSIQ